MTKTTAEAMNDGETNIRGRLKELAAELNYKHPAAFSNDAVAYGICMRIDQQLQRLQDLREQIVDLVGEPADMTDTAIEWKKEKVAENIRYRLTQIASKANYIHPSYYPDELVAFAMYLGIDRQIEHLEDMREEAVNLMGESS